MSDDSSIESDQYTETVTYFATWPWSPTQIQAYTNTVTLAPGTYTGNFEALASHDGTTDTQLVEVAITVLTSGGSSQTTDHTALTTSIASSAGTVEAPTTLMKYVTVTVAAPASSTSLSQSIGSRQSLSAGAGAGITIGAIAGFVALLSLCWLALRKRRNRARQPSQEKEPEDQPVMVSWHA